MIVGVPKETFPGERRVALVPAVVPTLAKAKWEVLVESGAGAAAFYPDAAYVEKGARIAASRAEVFASAGARFPGPCSAFADLGDRRGPAGRSPPPAPPPSPWS